MISHKIYLSMAALVMVGAMMSGCAEEIEVVLPAANKTVTMKTTISLDGKSATRALTEAGVKTFAAGDQIAIIYKNTAGETVKAESVALTAADIDASDAHKATFTVDLTNPKASEAVRYVYPASRAAASIAADAAVNGDATINFAALATQDGTFASLASDLDLAVFDGTMTSVGALPTGTGVILENLLTILKLQSIKNDAGVAILDKITSLTVDDDTNTYTVTRTAADAPIYVAMLPVAGDITITAEVGGLPCTKTATGKTLAKNKIYPVNLTMDAFNYKAIPLTFEAIEAGAQVNFDINTDVATNGVQYRTFSTASGWSDWADYTDNDPVTLASIGDKVQFWGDNEKYGSSPASNIQFDKDCYAYGNIMSLIKSTDFITETTLTGSYNFCKLFYNNTHLKSHADKQLMLPATTLTERCYSQMFLGCTSLTIAPKLPAMEMKKMCYGDMFRNCTSLIAVPDLPATTLAEYCYCNMFQGCTELVTALKLPATTLAEDCYLLMFDECSKLATVPADMLPATTLAEECYLQMFVGCTSLTTAPDLPATTLAKNCYNGMFGTCESLTTAPELRATTLTEGCYSGMFSSCTSLATAPELRATTLAKDCYSSMFSYCESLTTAPELRATTLAEGCYSSMFRSCESLTTAPELRATTLAPGCYSQMFYKCTKLSSVTCLATNISALDCLSLWLYGAGTEDGCERIVYVDPTKLNPATDVWDLDYSGEDGKRWTLSNKDFLSLTSADIGNVIGANGCIYANAAAATTAGTTALALICYVGNDAETSTTYNHGLALALSDASTGAKLCEQTGSVCLTTQKPSEAAAKTDMAGIANTDALVGNGSHTHAAASAARGYNSGTHPTGTSAWFLPSAGQWDKMITAASGYANLNTNAGLGSNLYWSSTERDSYYAWYYFFGDGRWVHSFKEGIHCVRSALAF